MANYTNVAFQGNNLQTSYAFVSDIDHFSYPEIDAKDYAVEHENYSVIPFVSFPKKTITVKGTITGTSIANCDANIDTYKGFLSTLFAGGNLDFDYNGGTRRYVAYIAKKPTFSRPNNLFWADFTIEFLCTQPFGRDITSNTLLSASARTSASYNDNVTFGGNAPYQLPIITITLTAVSASGSQNLQFGNNSNGQMITVSRSGWANGDIVVIDCTQKTVTVNGIAANFTGGFPEFPPGSASLSYLDSFTSRTFTISVVATNYYV